LVLRIDIHPTCPGDWYYYYCMTGRAIQGNIQFEGGSIIGPTTGPLVSFINGTLSHQITSPQMVWLPLNAMAIKKNIMTNQIAI
jgi:hypothetical protein